MGDAPPAKLSYCRARFSAQLPVAWLYAPTHEWLARQPDGGWRVGFTNFGTRMLGEMVECGFHAAKGTTVSAGQAIGWIEGFKAVVDLLCVGEGRFRRGNPALADRVALVNDAPFAGGWLYEFEGEPAPGWLDVAGYRALLDEAIDRLLRQGADGSGREVL